MMPANTYFWQFCVYNNQYKLVPVSCMLYKAFDQACGDSMTHMALSLYSSSMYSKDNSKEPYGMKIYPKFNIVICTEWLNSQN